MCWRKLDCTKHCSPKSYVCMYVCVCVCVLLWISHARFTATKAEIHYFELLLFVSHRWDSINPSKHSCYKLLDWGCGWREEEERWYCNQRKKEKKFYDLLLLLNPNSPNNKFRFSLVPCYFMGVQKQEEKEKYKTPYHTKQPSFYPTQKKKKLQWGALHDHTIPLKEITSSSAMNSMSKNLRD